MKCFKTNQHFNFVHAYIQRIFWGNKKYILNMTQDATLVHMLNVVLSRGQ